MHEACLDVVRALNLPGQGIDIFVAIIFIANCAMNTPAEGKKHVDYQV
jgi:hypothetical protein